MLGLADEVSQGLLGLGAAAPGEQAVDAGGDDLEALGGGLLGLLAGAGVLQGAGAEVEGDAAEDDEGDPQGAAAQAGHPGLALEAEDGEQRLHGGPASLWVGREAAEDGALEPAGQAGVAAALERGPARLAGADRGDEVGRGVADEGAQAVERLVEGDAEAELIAVRADALVVVLLGGHVDGGADEGAAAGDGGERAHAAGLAGDRGLVGGVEAGDAEVGDADAVVVADQQVVGLDVAVDEAGGVGRHEAAAGLHEHAQDLLPAARGLVEPAPHGAAGDEFHGDEDLTGVHADVVDGDDVGVGEAGEGLGLAQEEGLAVAGAVAVDLAVHELDGDLAIELGVVGGVDDAHAAGAELVDDEVAADPRGRGLAGAVRGERARRVGHGGRAEGRLGPVLRAFVHRCGPGATDVPTVTSCERPGERSERGSCRAERASHVERSERVMARGASESWRAERVLLGATEAALQAAQRDAEVTGH